MGLVFQTPHLLNHQTVLDNTYLYMNGFKVQAYKRANAALDQVNLYQKHHYHYTYHHGRQTCWYCTGSITTHIILADEQQ